MTEEKLNRARKLFYDHDGSRFYMSRNGVEKEFLSYNVPESLQSEWLADITNTYITELKRSGRRGIIGFLEHHGNYDHTKDILKSRPSGKLLDKVVFLEELVSYVKHYHLTVKGRILEKDEIEMIKKYLIENAEILLKKARAEEMKNRIERIMTNAKLL